MVGGETVKDWKETLREQIDRAADEIKASAFDTFTAAEYVSGAQITIDFDLDCMAKINYSVDVFSRRLK